MRENSGGERRMEMKGEGTFLYFKRRGHQKHENKKQEPTQQKRPKKEG